MKFWTKKTYAIGLLLAVLVPIAGRVARRHDRDCCALDGSSIAPAHRVRIVDQEGTSHSFCRIACAEAWLARYAAPPAAVFVTDEMTGLESMPEMMYYVRSTVGAAPGAASRTHVFANVADAQRHAMESRGRVLTAQERPLQDGGKASVIVSPHKE